MRYFVRLSQNDGFTRDTVEKTATPAEAINQAILNWAISQGIAPKKVSVVPGLGEPYRVVWDKPGCIGVSEERYFAATAEICSLFLVEGHEDVWAPNPAIAASQFITDNLTTYRKRYGDVEVDSTVPEPGDFNGQGSDLLQGGNWVITVYLTPRGTSFGELREHYKEEISIKAVALVAA